VFFSRGMNRSSVERSWHLTPAVRGAFSWARTSVSFRPRSPLSAGQYYRLSVGRKARDDQGKALQNPLSVAFSTGVRLRALNVTPVSGTTGVPINGLIAVTFNHPMVALSGLEIAAPDPAGWRVSVRPATAGHGSWLGTSTWVFHPYGGLAPSSAYTVRVSGSVRDAWGEPLGRTVQWTFHTATPAVVAETPGNGARLADPQGPVTVAFNQPMDSASAARAFSVQASGRPVPGAISWQGNTLIFKPSAPLDFTKEFTALVGRGARSANGAASLGSPVTWSFHVASPPQVVSSMVPGGTSGGSGVELHFSAPMDQSSLDHHLSISPPLQQMSTALYGATNASDANLYSIYSSFDPSTAYTVTLAAGSRDAFGRQMPSPFSLHFSTPPLDPSVALYGMPGYFAVSFSAGRVVRAPVQFVNVSSAHFMLVHTAGTDLNGGVTGSNGLTPPGGPVIREWTESIPHPLNHVENMSVPLATGSGAALAPGLYWLGAQALQASTGSTQAPSWSETVVAANTSLTMKWAADRTIVWAVSAKSGRVVAGAPVRLLDSNGHQVAGGRTDKNGVAVFGATSNQPGAALLDDGIHFGVASTGWEPNAGIQTPGEQNRHH
jgi:Bacterial Ig-like domain/Bacterial alpha-2-macroglobulin MG3 domain